MLAQTAKPMLGITTVTFCNLIISSQSSVFLQKQKVSIFAMLEHLKNFRIQETKQLLL
jgi:hypothetical protein